jgi:hypothetical protein
MGRISKSLSLILIVVLALSSLTLLTAKPATAQTIPQPSVPKFTVKFVDVSYDVPETYRIDPYTGKNITASSGYHVESKKLEVTIKNQAFISFLDASGNYTSLYYIFRYKGHFENDWQYYPPDPFQGSSPPLSPFEYDARGWAYINASSSEYTIILLPEQLKDAPADGQMDVQAQAMVGHDNVIRWGEGRLAYIGYYFVGESSDWSNTQTITLTDGATSGSINTSPYPTPTPTVPEFPIIVILPLFVAMFLMGFKLFRRKQISKSL